MTSAVGFAGVGQPADVALFWSKAQADKLGFTMEGFHESGQQAFQIPASFRPGKYRLTKFVSVREPRKQATVAPALIVVR